MRIENDWLDTEEGHSCGSWLGFDGAREWRQNNGSGLSLPVSVNDGTFLLADVIIVPMPSLRVDGLANST